MNENIIEKIKSIIQGKSNLSNEFIPVAIEVKNKGYTPTKLPDNKMGVYLFYFDKEQCFLKIGIVGPHSQSRWVSQHYSVKGSTSTLAKSIFNDNDFKKKYNIPDDNIGQWIKDNTDRIEILFDKSINPYIPKAVEADLHLIYNPKYEGDRINNE